MEQFARRRDAQHAALARINRLPLWQKISRLNAYEREALRPLIEAAGEKITKEKLAELRKLAMRSGDPILVHLNNTVRPTVDRVRGEILVRRQQRMEAVVSRRDNLGEHSSDHAVRAWAQRRAGEAAATVGRHVGLQEQFGAALEFTARWGIEPPPLPVLPTDQELAIAIARMTCSRWWRRKARRKLTLDIEQRAIAAGKVHAHAGVYVSDANIGRGRAQDQRNAQLLLNLVAENELGQQFSLADLVEKSLANPHIRLCELMVRIKGMEAVADALGYVGLFLTWTLPSRYHARLSGTGKENPNWTADKLTPRAGQLRLRELWAWARAALAKLQARYFGVRVAEPHHDGTPHWHLLMFVKPQQREEVARVLRGYAMLEAPDEDGADKHRFKVELIDKSKGGATHYVAKYISKMTTGAGLGKTRERGADGVQREVADAGKGASRARRWASVHGIRQFQAFGVPPIGIWRELRRLEGPPPTTWPNGLPVHPVAWSRLENARKAADEGDYGRHLRAIGGPALPRAQQPLMVMRRIHGDLNAYGELRTPQTEGVCERIQFVNVRPVKERVYRAARRRKNRSVAVRSFVRTALQREVVRLQGPGVVTRLHTWILKPRAEGAAVAVAVEREVSSQGAAVAPLGLVSITVTAAPAAASPPAPPGLVSPSHQGANHLPESDP